MFPDWASGTLGASWGLLLRDSNVLANPEKLNKLDSWHPDSTPGALPRLLRLLGAPRCAAGRSRNLSRSFSRSLSWSRCLCLDSGGSPRLLDAPT